MKEIYTAGDSICVFWTTEIKPGVYSAVAFVHTAMCVRTFTRAHTDRRKNWRTHTCTHHITSAWRSKGCKRGGGDIDFSVESLRGNPEGGLAFAYTPQVGELTTLTLWARHTHTYTQTHTHYTKLKKENSRVVRCLVWRNFMPHLQLWRLPCVIKLSQQATLESKYAKDVDTEISLTPTSGNLGSWSQVEH